MARNDAAINTSLRGTLVPVGANIKRAQAERGITVDALAAEIGVSPRLLQKWRAGNNVPRIENLLKLSDALGREVAWFYMNHDDEPVAA